MDNRGGRSEVFGLRELTNPAKTPDSLLTYYILFPHSPNFKYITNIIPVGELSPLPYCLSREFLARDTCGYAPVEGTHIYICV